MDSSANEGASGRGVDPDPLPVSDLPAPLLSFDDFLFGAAFGEGRDDGGGSGSSGGCASDREGKGGRGGGGREVRDGRNRPEDEVIHFEPTPFDHPVFIMFSSGTTGLPKCMVHGAGGACESGFRLPCESVSLETLPPPPRPSVIGDASAVALLDAINRVICRECGRYHIEWRIEKKLSPPVGTLHRRSGGEALQSCEKLFRAHASLRKARHVFGDLCIMCAPHWRIVAGNATVVFALAP